MKPTFHHRLVNSAYEDPSLFVRMTRERRAFLFDAGRIDRLTSGDLLKVTDLFVTHMHIDHFIGFDTLLRALLRRETPLRVYGPERIIEAVEGKLRGYTWNLIEEYPIKIEVFEISEAGMRSSCFYAENCFRRVDRETVVFDGIAMRDQAYTVGAAILSHGIPCLGFSLKEDIHINIDKAALSAMELPVGPWLGLFKNMIRDKAGPDTGVSVDGREFRFSDLSHIATITEGQKVSFVTDVSPGEENVNSIIELVRDSDTLYCEAYFLEEDRERAVERHHLTAKMAGEIAREAKVRNLVLMHFSPKYIDQAEKIEEEAMREYKGL
jgi:ribonuclease Z